MPPPDDGAGASAAVSPAHERHPDDQCPLTDPPARYPADAELAAAVIEGPVTNLVRWFRFLGVRPGEHVELQALDVPQPRSAYRPNYFAHASSVDEFVRLCGEGEKMGAPAVYVLLNQIDPAVVTRAQAGVWHQARKGQSTNDADIQARRDLFIDIDPERPSGTSSKDEQMDEAHAVAKAIADRLSILLESSDPILRGHSGNGASVMVALDYIPCTPEVTSTIKDILTALGALHGTERIKIDQSVSDPKRLAPAFGTMKRKGAPDVPERPHRRSACVCSATVRRIGQRDLESLRDALVALVPSAPKKQKSKRTHRSRSTSDDDDRDPWKLANAVDPREVSAWLGVLVGDVVTCPGCRETKGVDIIDHGLKCHHDRCADKGRNGFRTNIDLVMEVGGVDAKGAYALLAEQFGLEPLKKKTTTQLAAPAEGPVSAEDPLARLSTLTDLTASAEALNDVRWLLSVADAGEGVRARVSEALAVHVGKAAINRAFKSARELANKEKRAAAEAEIKGTWRENLLTTITNDGRIVTLPVAANVTTILRYSEEWQGVVAYDEFLETVVKLRPPSWDEIDAPAATEDTTADTNETTRQVQAHEWTDADTARLGNWLSRNERLHLRDKIIETGIMVAAESTVVHPVRDYLDSLEWDGVERLSTMLPTYWRTRDTEYTREVAKRWMISGVARIYHPGCQADCVLIVEQRDQGGGKSSAFRALPPVAGWYADTGINPGDKDSYQNLRGVWIYGFDELDSIRRSDVTRTKNFVTQTIDRYRPSYARRAKGFPRRNVFCGTTNEETYLVDRTGNRRYWPVQVELGKTVDVEGIVRDRDQLWAEARDRFRRGENWWLDTRELQKLAQEEQDDRVQEDAWDTIIARWLENPQERVFGQEIGPLYDLSCGVLTIDVLVHAIGISKQDVHKSHVMRVTEALKSLGYIRGAKHTEGGTEVRRYKKPTDAMGGAGATPAAPPSVRPAYTPPPLAPAHVPYAFDHLEGGRGGRGVVDRGGRPETSMETLHPEDLDHLDHLNSVIEVEIERDRLNDRNYRNSVTHIEKPVVEVVGGRAGTEATAGDAAQQHTLEIDNLLLRIVNQEPNGIELNHLAIEASMWANGHHNRESVLAAVNRLVQGGRIFIDENKTVYRMP